VWPSCGIFSGAVLGGAVLYAGGKISTWCLVSTVVLTLKNSRSQAVTYSAQSGKILEMMQDRDVVTTNRR